MSTLAKIVIFLQKGNVIMIVTYFINEFVQKLRIIMHQNISVNLERV